ncbi:MAG: protease modulator HflC [Hyphomicrobiaceae bacterium]
MLKGLLAFVLVVLGAAAAAVYFSAFIVRQTQQAIVLQFGEPVSQISTPGLHWKIPVAQTVEYFDKRVLDLDSSPQEVIASDQKRLVVDAFARFKIVNPLLFYQTVRDERTARERLGALLEGALRRALGAATFTDVVRDKREALMSTITEQVNQEAADLGIQVIDVRIKRADLPDANSEAIYRRMQTERQREAAEARAEGSAAANRIRATADREATVIKAEATKKGEQTRGEGDAERNRVFAEAFGKDPDFFGFYRSMQAYREGIKSGDTRLVLSPDSEFFRYFNNPLGTPPPAANQGGGSGNSRR